MCPQLSGDAALIFRPWDRLQPYVCLDLTSSSSSSSSSSLWSLISAAALRSALPELTVKTFPAVIQEQKPLLILFVDQPQESTTALLAAAKEGEREGKSVAAQLAKVV